MFIRLLQEYSWKMY